MKIKDSITRWDKYLKQITEILDSITYDIQKDNFADSSDAVTLICLHSQLYSALSTAVLGRNLVKTTLDELLKSNITSPEGRFVKHDESKDN